MASRQIIWEVTAYANFTGRITKAKMLEIMNANTPEEKEVALKWASKEGKRIIAKCSKTDRSNELCEEAKKVFNIKE